MTDNLFYILSGVIVASAILTLSLKNLFHCALFLARTMFGVSGIFLYLGSEFLAAVQVLIYVGAVTVLVIFGIMLTRNVMDERIKTMNNQALLSMVIAMAVTLVAFLALIQSPFVAGDHPVALLSQAASNGSGDVYALGPELIRPDKGFAFAFELVSVLLLSALVGAIVIARKDKEKA